MHHVKSLLPVLSHSLRKGSCGRLAVIGGSEEYTGAPFFSAITAIKLGADLVHVLCAAAAAPVIKGYSPDLIVHPGLNPENVLKILERMDVIVLGPGLGRDAAIIPLVQHVLAFVQKKEIPLIVDADGLWFIGEKLDGIDDVSLSLPTAILTPNIVEFSRLSSIILHRRDVLQIQDTDGLMEIAKQLSNKLNTSLFVKGKDDFIVNPDGQAEVSTAEGSMRRCGGQGDIVSGCLAMFLLWALKKDYTLNEAKIAAGLACGQLTRKSSLEAFKKEGRSMIASDIINVIPYILRDIDRSIESSAEE